MLFKHYSLFPFLFCLSPVKRFSKGVFNPDEMVDFATNLLYTREIKRIMAEQLTEPSADFVKFFTAQVYTGRQTSTVVEKFTEITKRSLKEFINDRVTDRLKTAIDIPDSTTSTSPDDTHESASKADPSVTENESAATNEEMEGFYIIKAILREVIDISYIELKATKSYIGINLNGKVSKTICRLWFRSSKKFIGILDADGKEAKQAISKLDEVYGLSEILKDRAKYLTQNTPKQSKTVES